MSDGDIVSPRKTCLLAQYTFEQIKSRFRYAVDVRFLKENTMSRSV